MAASLGILSGSLYYQRELEVAGTSFNPKYVLRGAAERRPSECLADHLQVGGSEIMPRALAAAIFLIFLQATPGAPTRPSGSSDSGGVLRQLSFASFSGSGNSVQAVATDANGNVYVTGTTAGGFPVKNAAQSNFGDARILLTTDLGVTWTRVGSPPADVGIVAADPVAPETLFAAGSGAIYKSEDGGQTWNTVLLPLVEKTSDSSSTKEL